MMSIGSLLLRRAACTIAAALMVAVFGVSCLDGPTTADDGRPGVSDGQVLFGQSAAFTGPVQALGRGMRLGIQSAFHEANQAGGVHGRQLKLQTLDDGYEPDLAVQTTKRLIETKEVFALIGSVGTPTSRVALPLARESGVPFLAPFTGAEFLRDPLLDNVANVRASYHQEIEEMIARLTQDLGITQVGVFYQDDSFGRDGLEGVRRALGRRGLEPVGVWHYQRGAGTVKRAVARIVASRPEAVVMIGTQEAVSTAIKGVQDHIHPVFMAVSFVGGKALAKAMGDDGHGVYITQVVPFPEDAGIPVVARYQAALSSFNPRVEPGFVSLEGYLAGRLAIYGLEACGRELMRECFIETLHNADVIDIDGFYLDYGPDDNQGSDAVFLTVIDADGKLRHVDKLEADH